MTFCHPAIAMGTIIAAVALAWFFGFIPTDKLVLTLVPGLLVFFGIFVVCERRSRRGE